MRRRRSQPRREQRWGRSLSGKAFGPISNGGRRAHGALVRRVLEATRSADRFILDFILIVILLGVVGYIISMIM